LRAEEEAAKIVTRAREERTQRLKQATIEAEKTVEALRKSLHEQFQKEIVSAGTDTQFAASLKSKTENEISKIDRDFAAHKNVVVDLLLHHVTSVGLDVSEAMRQALFTRQANGES